MKQLVLFMGPKYSTLKYFFLIWLTSVWFVIELLLLVTPHAQRERGKVIGHGVHIYICGRKKNLNRTLEIDSPFQTLTVGLLVEFID